MSDPEYTILNKGGNSPPWANARLKKNAGPTDILANYNRIQSELWDYYAIKEFPEIIGTDRHAVLSQWFHRAPFGQPRYVDINALRTLGESPWVEMCMKVRINEIATLEWDILPLDPDHPNDTAIEDAREFISHPNQNQESFPHVLKGFLRDLFWFDAGVIVKTFSGIHQERKFAVPELHQEQWGTTLSRKMPFPDQYKMYRQKGRLIKSLPATGAKLEEFFARDGGSFAKDVDEFGITRGYWQYTFKYPAAAPIPFSDREIIYAMLNPITASPYGKSPIENLYQILNTLVASTLWNYKFFEEGGIPEGILAIMNMSIDDFKIWRAYFTEEIQGNPHKLPMINPGMGGDVKWIPFAPNQADLEFLNSQKWYLHLVAALFEVNFNELGFTETVNRASSEEQSQVFKRRAIRPLLDTIEWYINLELMQELWNMGMPDTVFKFIPIIDSFEQARRTANFVSEINVGLRVVNEIRQEELGLDDVEWGDKPPQFWQTPQAEPYDPFGEAPPPKVEDNDDMREQEEEEDPEENFDSEELINSILKTLNHLGLIKKIGPWKDFDACVENFMGDPDFKPRGEYATKREAAQAVCAKIEQEGKSQKGGFVSRSALGVLEHPPNPHNQAIVDGKPPMLDLSNMPEESKQKLYADLRALYRKQHDPEPEPIGEDSFYNLPNPSNIAKKDPRTSSTKTLEDEFERELADLFKTQEIEILKALGGMQKGVGLDRIRAALDTIDGRFFKNLIDMVRRFIVRALKRGGNKAHAELKLSAEFELRDEDAERYMQDFSALLAKSKFEQVRDRVRKILVQGLEKGENVDQIGDNLQKAFSSMKRHESPRIARTETMRAYNQGREAGYLRSGMIKAKQWLVTWDDRLCEQCRPLANQTIPLGKEFMTYSGVMVKNPPLHPNCRCTIVPVLKPEVRRTGKGFYKPTTKMLELETHFGKKIKPLLEGLLVEKGSLNQLADFLNKEVGKITVMSLSNWCRALDVETLPKGGDTSTLRNKNGSE